MEKKREKEKFGSASLALRCLAFSPIFLFWARPGQAEQTRPDQVRPDEMQTNQMPSLLPFLVSDFHSHSKHDVSSFPCAVTKPTPLITHKAESLRSGLCRSAVD